MSRHAVIAMLLTACSANAAPPDSCDYVASASGCQEFVSGRTLEQEQTLCADLGGTFAAATRCPAGNRVGRCTEIVNGSTTIEAFYPPNWDTNGASTACTTTHMMYPNITTSFQAN